MKLRLAARGLGLSTELKAHVERRVHFNLGRFAGKIRCLSIRLADINGPRGGLDKGCDIRVDLGLGQQLIVRERQASVQAAVAFALDRAERAVQRQVKAAATSTGMATIRTVGFAD